MWRRGRRSTAWSARTPTWSGFRWRRHAVYWRATASSASGGLDVEQHVLRLRDLHRLWQRRVGPDDRDRLLKLVRRNCAVRQIEVARGGQPRFEVAALADDARWQPARQVLGLAGADAL